MPRRLVLLRHAKSAWPDEVADPDRPLAGRGRREAPLAGRWLAEHVPGIDLVVCSPALRTRQTWERVHAELGTDPEFRIEERLYDAPARQIVGVAGALPDTAATVLFIGHNPGTEDVIAQLTGSYVTMATSSIAVLAVPGDWSEIDRGGATLEAHETPRG